MKFLLLDVYPRKSHRLVKDTAGGYGTGNNFGNSLFSKFLNFYVDNSIGMPAIEIMIISSILKKKNDVYYTRNLDDKKISECDYIILPSSIIAHETEISAIKKLNNKKIFVTGIFANVLKNEYSKENTIVVKNEADTFFYNLSKSDDLNVDTLDKFFRNKDLINQYYSPVHLDDFPYPDWGDYSKNYSLKNNFFNLKNKIAVPILATRGCPYSCFHYCTYPLQQGRKVRSRSVENIVSEIKYWQKKLNTNKFIFRDPVFSINKKHTIELCKEIIKQRLNISYMIETHLNNLGEDIIGLLKESGLKLAYVGVESANNFVLNDMKRFTIQKDKQYQIIKKCEKEGIKIKTMFIIGNPEDTNETVLQSINYSKHLPSLYTQFSVFTPYPGTPAFNEYKHLITENKYENFDQYNLTFKHKFLSKNDVNKLKNLAYFKFYFNIKKIFNILIYLLKSKFFND